VPRNTSWRGYNLS